MKPSLLKTVGALYTGLSSRRRVQLILLFFLMLLGAVAEAVSLGAILPFLAILVDPQQAIQNPAVARLAGKLGVIDVNELRWHFTLLFAAAAIAAGLVRFVLIYATARLNFGIGHELGAEIYRRTLYQSYDVHIARNSSEIMGGIRKVDEVVWVIFAMLNMTSGALMGGFIVIALLLIDPLVASSALLGLGSIYAVISVRVRKKLHQNSSVASEAMSQRVQTMQEGLGGIRDILLDHTQEIFLRRFTAIDWPMRQSQASNNIIGPSPRFAVEAFGIVLIAVLGYSMSSSSGGLGAAVPALGALALGVQRLMPLIQQAYQGWAQVSGNRQFLQDVVELLSQPVDEVSVVTDALPFEHEICLEQVSFRYRPQLPLVLNGVSFTITKGSRVGIVGTTGSGKSTAMDLFMGLLQPTEGLITVDGVPLTGRSRFAWQNNIAHVPQNVFLADASFAENIAFGVAVADIDYQRVREAAKQAQIADFIESSIEAYQTTIGERGVRLSGGQRQRIGIARALYKRANILVFDEATSALDNKTEAAVIASIKLLGRDLTILMIAHRISTLKDCDVIIEIQANGNSRIVSSNDVDSYTVRIK